MENQSTCQTWRGHRAAIILLATLAVLVLTVGAQAPKTPPTTRTDHVTETLHGVEIADPYRWLEDQNSPETRAWIAAQNEYTQSRLEPLPGRTEIMRRLSELMRVETISTPKVYNGRYFFTKRAPEQELSVLYMRKTADGPDE